MNTSRIGGYGSGAHAPRAAAVSAPERTRGASRRTGAPSPHAAHDGAPAAAVPAVVRAVRVLDTLAAAREPISLAALTQTLGLAKSTVHGLCMTLVHLGMAARFANGGYHIGPHVMDLAHAFVGRTELATEFVRLWDSLALLPTETIILSVLDGADVVYVAARNGTHPLGLNFRIGMRLPANCTASGKALLSTLPPEHLSALSRGPGFRKLTRRSVTDLPTLTRQLALARRRGYTVDDGETRDGMICFGAPVFDSRAGSAAAGVAVSLLKAEQSARARAAAAHAVRHVAETLSERLGARTASLGA